VGIVRSKRGIEGLERPGISLLALLILAWAGCGSPEPAATEASPVLPPAEEEPPQKAIPTAPRPEVKRPNAPIPPLEGAERPTQSPLVTILEEELPPVVDPPELELPELEEEVAAEPSLDLEGLSERLRTTEALGVFTKVALKNQIDDLLDELTRFHRKGRGRLDRLRERYDSLVLKIMSLVQDEEPQLASDIDRSRERIWELLADPQGFAELAQGEMS
jgi:hypothetical protein